MWSSGLLRLRCMFRASTHWRQQFGKNLMKRNWKILYLLTTSFGIFISAWFNNEPLLIHSHSHMHCVDVWFCTHLNEYTVNTRDEMIKSSSFWQNNISTLITSSMWKIYSETFAIWAWNWVRVKDMYLHSIYIVNLVDDVVLWAWFRNRWITDWRIH